MARTSWMWRLALRLLPREFRERHGEEMTRLLEEQLDGRGTPGRLSVHIRALADAVGIAATRRWSAERGWTMTMTEGWGRDLAYAARMLVRRPGLTSVAVLTLALGIGVTTAVATLLYTVVLAPTPYEDPDEIVQIAQVAEGRRNVMLPTADARTLRQSTSEFLTLGLVRFQDVSVGGSGAAERVRGMIVTGPTLPMLGVQPLLGRLPDASDDVPGGPCVVALSHGLWTRRFVARPDVVGTDANLDGRPCTVVAVMPEGFAFPAPYFAPGDLWLLAGPSGLDSRVTDEGWFLAFGLAGGLGPGGLRGRVRGRTAGRRRPSFRAAPRHGGDGAGHRAALGRRAARPKLPGAHAARSRLPLVRDPARTPHPARAPLPRRRFAEDVLWGARGAARGRARAPRRRPRVGGSGGRGRSGPELRDPRRRARAGGRPAHGLAVRGRGVLPCPRHPDPPRRELRRAPEHLAGRDPSTRPSPSDSWRGATRWANDSGSWRRDRTPAIPGPSWGSPRTPTRSTCTRASRRWCTVRWEDAPERSMVILAHTAGLPLAAAASLREAVATLDPDLPLFGVVSASAR